MRFYLDKEMRVILEAALQWIVLAKREGPLVAWCVIPFEANKSFQL